MTASANIFASNARAGHFEAELKRARDLWSGKPNLGDCTVPLHEKADQELCRTAELAILAIEGQFAAPPERVLPTLADGALALTRLAQRARYLSLGELSSKQLGGDAGVALPMTPTGARPSALLGKRLGAVPNGGQRSLELANGPASRMMSDTVRLERDVLRNLGAYLEYAELPVRRSAFESVRRLRGEHPQWPLLEHLVREAGLLESDPDLKRRLEEFSEHGLPRGSHPGQTLDSK